MKADARKMLRALPLSICICACIGALIQPGHVRAQSITEAVRSALDTNASLQAERLRLSATMEQQIQARNLRRPVVQFEANTALRATAAGKPRALDLSRAEPGSLSLQLIQPLYLGGRYEAALREADLRVGQSIARIRGRELLVVRQVIEAYSNVRRDYQVSAIREEGIVALTRQLVGARLRRDEGLVGLTEVSQVESRLASAKSAASNAQARLQASWATLERLIGSRPVGLSEDSFETLILPSSLSEAIETAENLSHDLKAARYNEYIATAIARAAQVENAPSLSLQANVAGNSDTAFNGSRVYSAQIGARFVVPIWNGGQPQSRARAALSEANAARVEATGLEGVLAEQVTQAWASLEAANRAIIISEGFAKSAQTARIGAELEFDVGLRSIIEVLNQEQELQEAKVGVVVARSNLLSSQAVLATLVGLDPTGVINKTTEFDPIRDETVLSQLRNGKVAIWERPLVGVFDGVNQALAPSRHIVRNVKRGILGPEQ